VFYLFNLILMFETKKLYCVKKQHQLIQLKPRHFVGLAWFILYFKSKLNQPTFFLSCDSDDFYPQNRTKLHHRHPLLVPIYCYQKQKQNRNFFFILNMVVQNIVTISGHVPVEIKREIRLTITRVKCFTDEWDITFSLVNIK